MIDNMRPNEWVENEGPGRRGGCLPLIVIGIVALAVALASASLGAAVAALIIG